MNLYYPVKPCNLLQGFGSNPEYYARFLDANGNPEKGHMGADFAAPHATPLYSPVDGDAFYTHDAHGGAGIYIRWPNNVTPQYDVILWHLCTKDDPQFAPLIPTDGSIVPVKIGQKIGYTDNSGAPFESNGDHLHLGVLPVDNAASPLNPNNGFGGCVDPIPFMNGNFAQDYPIVQQLLSGAATITTEITTASITPQEKFSLYSLIAKVVQLLSRLP